MPFFSMLGIIGLGIGIPIGIILGFLFLLFFEPRDVKEPAIKKLHELDTGSVIELLPYVPIWMKSPDYHRIDWLNKFISDMWPYLDKAICNIIRSTRESIMADYIGKYMIKSIEFKCLTLGNLPPLIHGIKVQETNENELVFEPAVRWAGNPNITVVLKLLYLPITIQLVDLQIFAELRITLKPLLPTFPCFGSIASSLMDKPHVDFGLKLLGGDLMSIPGFYHYVQETIKKQVASFYMWPQAFQVPVIDDSKGARKKPVGILHVKVVRALKLLKMDFLGTSDPYVKLSLSGDGLPAKRTSIKMKNLNPEWNEEFKLMVKDLESQVLQLHVYDWEKVGRHDNLGMHVVPLKSLTPHETKDFTLNLVKNTNPRDPQNKKWRGQLIVKLTFKPFREIDEQYSGPLDDYAAKGNGGDDGSGQGAGLLTVTIKRAVDVEGKHHNNPYAVINYKGETKRTKLVKKTRNPCWNEDFQFLLDESPSKEKIHIEVISKRTGFSFRGKESLGYVDINLIDVVHNGRINDKYSLINSKEGIIHVDVRWKVI
ncbi:hypothetical protein L6164_033680 [Bauhinia variegata]|uniref:Uncharacterized protein n=1 Tax=Bauhinia variegata TaxID=167791 RepID=A0ACB9KSM4_BAUVA|nr:hypothetical protein L6164_033680 [Bauhinia variegata]